MRTNFTPGQKVVTVRDSSPGTYGSGTVPEGTVGEVVRITPHGVLKVKFEGNDTLRSFGVGGGSSLTANRNINDIALHETLAEFKERAWAVINAEASLTVHARKHLKNALGLTPPPRRMSLVFDFDVTDETATPEGLVKAFVEELGVCKDGSRRCLNHYGVKCVGVHPA